MTGDLSHNLTPGLPVDACHVTRYIQPMIKTFADRRTRDLFLTGTAKRFPADLLSRTVRKLEYVDLVTSLDDLKVPPGKPVARPEGRSQGTARDGRQRSMARVLPFRGWRRIRCRGL